MNCRTWRRSGAVILASATLSLIMATPTRAAEDAGESLYRSAIAAQTGKGAALDLNKGKELLLKAAEAGSARAMDRLGDMYRLPDGGAPIDRAEARKWYDKAAALNDPYGLLWSAIFNDGTLSAAEKKQRAEKALKVAQEKAEKDTTAVFVVAVGYMIGVGVPQNNSVGVEALQQAAGDGDARAMKELAAAYAHGDGVPKDPAKAFEWHSKAAESGFSEYLMNVGICYDQGIGVPKDLAKALKYYLDAADRGSPRCMTNAAQMISEGQGVPAADPAKAAALFQKAADLGWPPAMFYLGMCYETGKGVAQDHDAALKWIRKSAAGENPRAKKYLADHNLPAS